MTRYRMQLPDTDPSTIIEYTKRLIASKKFPWLSSGGLDTFFIARGLPLDPQPWLHWFKGDPFVYYGHCKNYDYDDYIDFSFAVTSLGEL